jgi:hypothetical protein
MMDCISALDFISHIKVALKFLRGKMFSSMMKGFNLWKEKVIS